MPTMTDEITRLEEEISALREKLSEARRNVPPEPVADYAFTTLDGAVKLSELFGKHDDLLVVHNMGKSCPYCTLWADGFNGVTEHLESRTAFVLASPDDPSTQATFAASRGWLFRMVSTAGNDFTHDMGFEPEPQKYWPGVSAFRRLDDGTIVRTGLTTFGPGDHFCSVWHFFDLLAQGVDGWSPKYQYPPAG